MVSTGTMTSPTHSPSPSPDKLNMRASEALSRPHSRSHSRSREPNAPTSKPQRPVYLEAHRSTSQTIPRHTVSSRPSFESNRPASSMDIHNNGSRGKGSSARSRPNSVYVESNIEFLRGLDSSEREKDTTPPPPSGLLTPGYIEQAFTGHSISSQRSDHIESNVDFLRAMENESDAAKGGSKADRRLSSGSFVGKHVKRSSMPSISLSNTKTLLAGKFGDAFRRFEGNGSGEPNRTSSPPNDYLGPIAGSGPASEISNDERWESTTTEEMSPEAKRELEKRMLIQEEERVAAAAAKYKKEVSTRTPGEAVPRQGSSSKASSIQNKVKALLNENRAPTPRTAEGYGQYTDDAYYQSQQQSQSQDKQILRSTTAVKSEKMVGGDSYGDYERERNRGYNTRTSDEISQSVLKPRIMTSTEKFGKPSSANMSPTRPAPPPKPKQLRELDVATLSLKDKGEGARDRRWTNPKPDDASNIDVDLVDPDEWQRNFNQRYPSLSGLEMVETVVGNGRKS